jgi:hypothetical protein
MPILREELRHFVEVHNEHRIRADHSRPNHVHGRPNDLFRDRPMGRVHGFPPDLQILQRLQQSLATWGKFTTEKCIIMTNVQILMHISPRLL